MKKVLKYIPYLFIPIITASLGYKLLTYFSIKKVIIISPTVEITGLNYLSRKFLLFIDNNKLINELINKNPNIEEISIKKEMPSTLWIDIKLKQPIAYINTQSQKIGVDKNGVLLFKIYEISDLPVIEMTNSNYNISQNNDWRIVKAAQFIELLKSVNISVEKVILQDNENLFVFYLPEGTEVLVPFTSNPPTLAASLQIIVNRFRIEGKFIRRIDFRFEKPVVQLKNEEKNSSN